MIFLTYAVIKLETKNLGQGFQIVDSNKHSDFSIYQ